MRAADVFKRGFTLIELMIVVAIISILAVIAIPNFMKFQARSKQSEAKANLKSAYTAEKSYFQEKDTYSANIMTLGWIPERGNRYKYCFDGACPTTGTQRDSSAVDAPTKNTTGVAVDSFRYPELNVIAMPNAFMQVTNGNQGSFTVSAAAQIDADATVDGWSISSESRTSGASSSATTSCAAGNNPAGEPCNDLNDVQL